jgi:hypothetical protein
MSADDENDDVPLGFVGAKRAIGRYRQLPR